MRSGRAVVESLESRRFLSTTTLRIVSYNIEADIDGVTTPRAGLAAVLEGIGSEKVAGTARPIDILALEETTSNATTVKPIVNSLNAKYGAGTYAMSTLQATESGGDAADGNGPSALIYDDKTVKLLAGVGLNTALGSSSGIFRQVVRYEFQPFGGSSADDFYIYVSHYKSGSTSTDASERAGEAKAIRADEAALPANARVLYVGDFNASEISAAAYQTLVGSGNGQAFDPGNPTNSDPGTSPVASLLSESDTDLRYRDDYQVMTQNVLTNSSGLHLVAGSFHYFGNNGSIAEGGSVVSSGNTALAGLSNRTTLLTDLTTASDHLPVAADFTDTVSGAGGGTTQGSSKAIVAWDMGGQTKSGEQHLAPLSIDDSVSDALSLTRGSGVKINSDAATGSWGGTNWATTAAAGTSGKKYLSFGVTVNPGSVLSLASLGMHYRRTAGGPTSALWQYQLDEGPWISIARVSDAFSSTSKHGSAIASLGLSSISALQNLAAGTSLRIRLIPYGATSSAEGFYIYNEKGSDLEVVGTVS